MTLVTVVTVAGRDAPWVVIGFWLGGIIRRRNWKPPPLRSHPGDTYPL